MWWRMKGGYGTMQRHIISIRSSSRRQTGSFAVKRCDFSVLLSAQGAATLPGPFTEYKIRSRRVNRHRGHSLRDSSLLSLLHGKILPGAGLTWHDEVPLNRATYCPVRDIRSRFQSLSPVSGGGPPPRRGASGPAPARKQTGGMHADGLP